MSGQVSPQDWINTSVSRPLTVVVVYGPPPPRTSRHTGALLPGWVIVRSCCALTRSSCCVCVCPIAVPAMVKDSNRNSSLISFAPPDLALLVAFALILVLCELALLHRLFPA